MKTTRKTQDFLQSIASILEGRDHRAFVRAFVNVNPQTGPELLVSAPDGSVWTLVPTMTTGPRRVRAKRTGGAAQ